MSCLKNKNILHLIYSFNIGGVEVGIIKSAEKIAHSINYTVLVLGKIDPLLQTEIQKMNNAQFISFTGILKYFKAFFYLKKAKPAVIINSLWKSSPLAILFRLIYPKTKLVAFYHSASYANFLDKFFQKKIALQADYLLADSNSTKRFIQNEFNRNDAEVIPFIFNNDVCLNYTDSKLNPIIKFVYVGRLVNGKGIVKSIDVFKKLLEKGINCTYDIYGNGELQDSVQHHIKNNNLQNQVILKGSVSPFEVHKILPEYDFYFLLSDFEGMAMSVVEALNSSIVPVVHGVGEISSYCKNNENALVFAPSATINVIVDNLYNLILDEKKYDQMKINAGKTFTLENNYIDKLTSYLSNIINV